MGWQLVKYKDFKNIKSYTYFSKKQDENFYLPSNRITSIKSDFENNIWVSTYNGLHLFDKNKFFKFQDQLLKSLPSMIINSIEIKGNIIWLINTKWLDKTEL